MMLLGRLKGKAVALAHPVALAAQFQRHRAGEHIAKFLAHVRQIGFSLCAGLNCHQNRLDILLLRVGNQPVDGHAVVFLDEHILLAADGIIPLLVGEELVKRAAQRGQNILQRRERRRGLVAFQLGDKALGQLAAIGQLLLRQVVFLAEASQLAADVDAHKNAPSLVMRDFQVNIAMQIKTHFVPRVKRFEKTFRPILRFVRFFMRFSARFSLFFQLFLDFCVPVK